MPCARNSQFQTAPQWTDPASSSYPGGGLEPGPSLQEDQNCLGELGSPTNSLCWNSRSLASAQLRREPGASSAEVPVWEAAAQAREGGRALPERGEQLSQMGTPTSGTGKQRNPMMN